MKKLIVAVALAASLTGCAVGVGVRPGAVNYSWLDSYYDYPYYYSGGYYHYYDPGTRVKVYESPTIRVRPHVYQYSVPTFRYEYNYRRHDPPKVYQYPRYEHRQEYRRHDPPPPQQREHSRGDKPRWDKYRN
jgi:hypothetical protein